MNAVEARIHFLAGRLTASLLVSTDVQISEVPKITASTPTTYTEIVDRKNSYQWLLASGIFRLACSLYLETQQVV